MEQKQKPVSQLSDEYTGRGVAYMYTQSPVTCNAAGIVTMTNFAAKDGISMELGFGGVIVSKGAVSFWVPAGNIKVAGLI